MSHHQDEARKQLSFLSFTFFRFAFPSIFRGILSSEGGN